MRKLNLIVLLLLAIQTVMAYEFDVIITKSREQIQCVIVTQNEDAITYKLVDSEDSQIYTISNSEIEKIYFRNVDYALEQRLQQQREQAKADSIAAVQAAEERERLAREKAINDSIAAVRADEERIARAKADSVARVEANNKIRQFTGVIKAAPDQPETPVEQRPVNAIEGEGSTMKMFVYIVGLDETQEEVRQIIANDISVKLKTVEGCDIQYYSDTIHEDTDNQLISITTQNGGSLACVIRTMPFHDEYYIQVNLIETTNEHSILSTSTASSLASLNDILQTTDTIADQIKQALMILIHQEEEDEELRQFQAECDAQERARQQERQRQEQIRQTEEAIHNTQVQLQQSIPGLVQSISDLNATVNSYALDIRNTKSYPCKVVVAGRQLGEVNPRTIHRFLVSTDLYGTVQIIQTSGYRGKPAISTYIIPKQAKHATVTLEM